MATTQAIQWDEELTTGLHDEEGKPHHHFAILTIRDGKVVDADWGYHRNELEYAMEWVNAHQEDCNSDRCPCYARGVEDAMGNPPKAY